MILTKQLEVGSVYIKKHGTNLDKKVIFFVSSINKAYESSYWAIFENPDKKAIHDCGVYIWGASRFSDRDHTGIMYFSKETIREATHEEAIAFTYNIKCAKARAKILNRYEGVYNA